MGLLSVGGYAEAGLRALISPSEALAANGVADSAEEMSDADLLASPDQTQLVLQEFPDVYRTLGETPSCAQRTSIEAELQRNVLEARDQANLEMLRGILSLGAPIPIIVGAIVAVRYGGAAAGVGVSSTRLVVPALIGVVNGANDGSMADGAKYAATLATLPLMGGSQVLKPKFGGGGIKGSNKIISDAVHPLQSGAKLTRMSSVVGGGLPQLFVGDRSEGSEISSDIIATLAGAGMGVAVARFSQGSAVMKMLGGVVAIAPINFEVGGTPEELVRELQNMLHDLSDNAMYAYAGSALGAGLAGRSSAVVMAQAGIVGTNAVMGVVGTKAGHFLRDAGSAFEKADKLYERADQLSRDTLTRVVQANRQAILRGKCERA